MLDEHAEREFITDKKGVFLVIDDNALQDLDDSTMVKLFLKKDVAIRYAQSQSHGNVNHRVLTVTDQALVVGTMNELPTL